MSAINNISGSPTTPTQSSPGGSPRLLIRTVDQARNHWRAITTQAQASDAMAVLDEQAEGGHIDEETYRLLANTLRDVHNIPSGPRDASGPSRFTIRTADQATDHWRAITTPEQASNAMAALTEQADGGHIDEETYRLLANTLRDVHNVLQQRATAQAATAHLPVRPPARIWQPLEERESPAQMIPLARRNLQMRLQVPDPENPGRMISRAGLNQRQYQRRQVPDPDNPGQMISQAGLNQRQYQRRRLPDPNNPGQTISRAELNRLQYRQRQVQDPNNPEQTISRAELSRRQRQAIVRDVLALPDAENPEEPIPRPG